MRRGLVLVVLFVLCVSAVGAVSAEERCNPLGGADFCIESVETPSENLEVDEVYVLEVHVRNVGNDTGDVRILYGAELPEGQVHGLVGDANSVAPGEDVVVRQNMRVASEGYRTLNIFAMNPRETHLYDSTGYEHSLTATDSGVDWFEMLVRIEVILSLVIAILTLLYIWSRR